MPSLKCYIVATQHSWSTEPSYSMHQSTLEKQGYVTVKEVTVEYDELPQDIFIQKKIAALQEQQKEIRIAANAEVANIAEEIQKLACLSYVPAEERWGVPQDHGAIEVTFTEVL